HERTRLGKAAGVVDQDAHRAIEFPADVLDRFLHRGLVGDVRLHGYGSPATRLDRSADTLGSGSAGSVIHNDHGASLSQRQSYGGAKAPRPTANKSYALGYGKFLNLLTFLESSHCAFAFHNHLPILICRLSLNR